MLLLLPYEKGMLEAVFVIGPLGLMEIIHIELSNERRKVIVLKKSRKQSF